MCVPYNAASISDYIDPTYDLIAKLEREALARVDLSLHREPDVTPFITNNSSRVSLGGMKRKSEKRDLTRSTHAFLTVDDLSGDVSFRSVHRFLGNEDKPASKFLEHITDGEFSLEMAGLRLVC